MIRSTRWGAQVAGTVAWLAMAACGGTAKDAAPTGAATPTAAPEAAPVRAPEATPARAPEAKLVIQSVEFFDNGPMVAPMYFHGATLTVRSSLDTRLQSIDRGTKTERAGKISQAQFDALAAALIAADVTHARSQLSDPPRVGGSTQGITVITDRGTFEFSGPTRGAFPPGFAAIFDQRNQLAP